MGQHAAPFQHAAPAFGGAPMQHLAPHVVVPHPAMPPVYFNAARPPIHAMPTFTQPQHGNAFQAVNPNLQHLNPSLPLNNPNALRPNFTFNSPTALRPNLPLGNPSTLRPNFPLNNAGVVGATPPLNTPNGLRSSPNLVQQGNGVPPQRPNTPKPGSSQPLVNRTLLGPSSAGLQQTRPAFPAVNSHNRFWPLFKDSKFLSLAGHRRHFIPVGLLGVVLIGGSYWYPDGYVSMEGPACTGYTSDGCQLQWRMVDFEDGGGAPQCVQYCPRVGPPPEPEQVATLPPPPALSTHGACQTTIYSEPNFAGNSAPTGDSQPNLSESGWRNEIASIVVGAGTWEFFTEENFAGESVRLTPGTYPNLSEEWTKRIGSFMCAEPGTPRA